MKLTNKDLIINLMVESPSFREFVADKLMVPNSRQEEISNEIRSIGRNKIAQIKFLHGLVLRKQILTFETLPE